MKFKSFDKYLEKRIVRKITPDKSRARFLIKESEKSLEWLKLLVKKLGITDGNASSIVGDCYNVIMQIARAKMLSDGFSSAGLNAHEAEVSYLMKLGFSEDFVSFVDELRYRRNSITYYGKGVDKDYAEKVFKFIEKNFDKLRSLFE